MDYKMIKKTNNILKFLILLWIILFGVISNHPECISVTSDICHQKKFLFSVQQVSVLPSNTLALNTMTGCKDGLCCEEQKCKDEKKVLISGQYPDKIKQVWGNENKIVFTGNKSKKIFNVSYQNKIPKTNSIYILTQSFLC